MIIISSLSSCSFHGLPFRLLGATLQVPVDAISALILVVERARHFRDLPKLYGVCMLQACNAAALLGAFSKRRPAFTKQNSTSHRSSHISCLSLSPIL